LKFGVNAQLKIIRSQTTDKAAAFIDDAYVGLNELRFHTHNVDLAKHLLRAGQSDKENVQWKKFSRAKAQRRKALPRF
jgi:hypothetical protein